MVLSLLVSHAAAARGALQKLCLFISLLGLLAPPLVAQEPARAGCSSDLIYQQSLRAMQTAARRAGVAIDTDIEIYLGPESEFIFATIEGFENHDPLKEARDGLNMGMAYANKFEAIPDGFYVMEVFINPDDLRDAYISLVNIRGDRYDYVLEINADPYPELGPRKGLTTEAGVQPKFFPAIDCGGEGELECTNCLKQIGLGLAPIRVRLAER